MEIIQLTSWLENSASELDLVVEWRQFYLAKSDGYRCQENLFKQFLRYSVLPKSSKTKLLFLGASKITQAIDFGHRAHDVKAAIAKVCLKMVQLE